MYTFSDSEVSDSLLDGLLDYSLVDNGQMLAPGATFPPPTADQPPHHQVAPVHIQDPSEAQMLPDFTPLPPTDQEIAPPTDHEIAPYRLLQSIPEHIQDSSETQMLPASALPTDEPAHPPLHMLQAYTTPPPPPPTTDEQAHPPHHDQNAPNQIMEESNTHQILPAVVTFPPTNSEPDHQPPPHQGAPGQDESKALMLVPSTTPPPTEPQKHGVVIDIGSDSESDDSDEVRILGSFTPLALPPPTTTTPSTSGFGESPLLYPVPVSWIHPSELRLQYHHGESTDDERTETDDDVLPPPPPPQPSSPPQQYLEQQYLEQQLALALHHFNYWRALVDRDTRGEPKRPDWLPDDWRMECVTRTSGSSAGNTDKYYIEPGRNRKFRSKREVLHFLETGERVQNKRKENTAMPSYVRGPSEGTASSSRQNFRIASHLEASTSRQNEETPNLDSDAVPEKQNEETPPNVDSDQNPPKRPRGSPSK